MGLCVAAANDSSEDPDQRLKSLAKHESLETLVLMIHIDRSFDSLWAKVEEHLNTKLEEVNVKLSKRLRSEIVLLREDLLRTCPEQELSNMRYELSHQLTETFNDQLELFQQLQAHLAAGEQAITHLEHSLQQIALDARVYTIAPTNHPHTDQLSPWRLPAQDTSFTVASSNARNRALGGGWIVFQQRYDGSVNFYRDWADYREGFGDIGGEFWLGFEKLHRILQSRPRHELLIELEDTRGVTAYAHYDDFVLGDEHEQYALFGVGRYQGTAGDSLSIHEGSDFATYDRRQNECPEHYQGAWWFLQCYDSHLNGVYTPGLQQTYGGIIWHTFRGDFESLRATRMLVRPLAPTDH
ncbi:fibrinogen C domain-containing protein 1-like [Anopheles nili]|uniref:fibrinogen C domain-containing protein 1-like n=1 Tax=Anopheles nili TaxID=185578 RepID=UPI00237AD540|nr:fibrinogen C domain-containing protein 1-like [Anopheles nili]